MNKNDGFLDFLGKIPWNVIRIFAYLFSKICRFMLDNGKSSLRIFGTTINLTTVYDVLQMLCHICDTMILLTAEELRTLDWTEFVKHID